jgi:hypothetical protein
MNVYIYACRDIYRNGEVYEERHEVGNAALHLLHINQFLTACLCLLPLVEIEKSMN